MKHGLTGEEEDVASICTSREKVHDLCRGISSFASVLNTSPMSVTQVFLWPVFANTLLAIDSQTLFASFRLICGEMERYEML